jgi:cobyrinic acid a,c-diamide synthase
MMVSIIIVHNYRCILILSSGVSSGVGKTSIAVGIMAALHRRGLRVQPFKVGPDFLDPMHHSIACGGVPSVNLDGWMMGREGCIEAFQQNCIESNADVAVIEVDTTTKCLWNYIIICI